MSDDVLDLVLGKLDGVRQQGGYWMAKCPAHEDRQASLSVKRGTDHPVVLHCHAGCELDAILAELGLTRAGISKPREDHPGQAEAMVTYDYTDERGKLLFQVCRMPGKKFRQRRPDPAGRDGWAWNLKDVKRVPYHLPQLRRAARGPVAGRVVYIVEGEKDVHAIEAAGAVATCNPGGAGKWRPEYNKHFAGIRKAVIVADRDEPGRKHAAQVAEMLRVLTITIVEAAEGKDAADHLAAGHGLDDFRPVGARESAGAEPDAEPDGTEPATAEAVWDPADPLTPIKTAVKECSDADLLPGKIAALVEAMARDGMAYDHPGRLTVRTYLRKENLLGPREFDRIVKDAIQFFPLTPANLAHSSTPPADQEKDLCDPNGVCAHTPRLADAEDLLAAAAGTVHELGVTGEARIVKGTYLTAVSQVLAEPLSLVVKGTSAGGKSYSTRNTLRLCPEEEFYQVTAGSQRSLIFTEEEFTHRTIVMFEATALREVAEKRDGDMTAMIVRTLLSEGQLIYDVTERGDDGRMTTRRIVKKGPTNLIITTTADNLHHENETRLLSLTVDESEEQTRAVMVKTAFRRNQPEPADPPDLAPWHELFHWLKHHGEHRVYIPYADYLANATAAAVVRMRRDFGVLLGVIEAHAVLHQMTRERDQHGRIIATAADYEAAVGIVAEAFAITSGKKIKEAVRKAVAAVETLGGQHTDVTVAQVAVHLKRERSRASRGLKDAADLGYLTNQETREGRAARYRLGPDDLPEDKPALPLKLPDDLGASTPAQLAQVSQQVSEGCAGVRGVQGGVGEGNQNLCTGCGRQYRPAHETGLCYDCRGGAR